MKSISIACLLSVPVWAIIMPSPRESYAEALWDSEVQCLAIALWHEARGEPLEGRRAVAEVILNRRDSGRFPDTVCEKWFTDLGIAWELVAEGPAITAPPLELPPYRQPGSFSELEEKARLAQLETFGWHTIR